MPKKKKTKDTQKVDWTTPVIPFGYKGPVQGLDGKERTVKESFLLTADRDTLYYETPANDIIMIPIEELHSGAAPLIIDEIEYGIFRQMVRMVSAVRE